MAYFKSNKIEIANILKGTSNPTSSIGDNGQLYLKYIDIADAYSLREYIEVGNTAGPYINTGLTTSSNDAKLTTEAEVIYSYTDRPDHNTWMFGAFSGYGIILGYQNGQTEGYVGSGGKLLDYDTNVHTVAFKDGGLYADDALKQTGNWTQIPNNTPIYIFGRGGDSRVIKNTKIYRCKIWQNGALLRDLIPVQRKSDDEIGMLDLVNNVFYDNDGTGSFTCGGTSDISSPIFKSYAKVNGQWQNLIGTDIDDILAGGSKYIKTTGSFTSGTAAQQKVEVNCGFKPDLVMVDMEFGNGVSRATYLSTAWYEETDHPISIWDLRPMESVIYAITPESVEGETGITDLTDTGFKYRVNGGNTQGKACTYTAIKFDVEEVPEPIVFKNLAYFSGQTNNYILLPLTSSSSDYEYEITWYDIAGHGNDDAYVICDSNYDTIFIRHRYNYYSLPVDNPLVSVPFAEGEHTAIFNRNSKVLFDNTEIGAFKSQASRTFMLASRNGGYLAECYIKEFKVTEISTGNVIYDFKPCLYNNLQGCIYDTINEKFYYLGTASASPVLQVMDTIPTT